MVACLTVWSILTAWRSNDDWEVLFYKYRFVLKRAGDRILASMKRFAPGIFRPRLHRAYPIPHSLEGIGSNGITITPVTEHQDRSA